MTNVSVAQERQAAVRFGFPDDESVGFLEIFDEKSPDLATLASEDSTLVSAFGPVDVAVNGFVGLTVRATGDLEFLNSLPRDSLHRLQLRGREIGKVALSSITRFEQLRVLDLDDCRFSEDAFDDSGILPNLQRLTVSTEDGSSRQHLASLANWVAKLPNLEYLYATPSLDAISIQALRGHRKLSAIRVDIEQDRYAIIFKLLDQLPALSGLIVSVDADVSPRALDRLSSVSNLESLTLIHAAVDGSLLKALSQCSKLNQLRMISIRPGAEFHEGLRSVLSLERISLTTGIWDDDRAETAFFKSLPETLLDLPEIRELPSMHSLSEPLFDRILARRKSIESLHIDGLRSGFDIARLSSLSELRELRTLKLTSIPIEDGDLKILSGLEKLEYLSLIHTNVTGSGFKHLARLPNLERLQIMMDRRIIKPELGALAELSHLKRFQLFGLGFRAEDFFPISRCSTIRHLALSQGQLDDAVIEQVSRMSQLENIHLMETQLTDVGAGKLAMIPSLRSIVLSGNVTPEGVRSLSSIPHLVRLHVSSPNFNEQDLLRLPEFFPQVSDIGFRIAD